MKITLEKDTLTELLAMVAKVFMEPYDDFVRQLAKDGRIEQEELQQLFRELRDRANRLPELMEARANDDSG